MCFWRQLQEVLGLHGVGRGIEAKPEKVEAILDMLAPWNTNEVQKLVGQVEALSRFVSRSTDKFLYFFKVLQKAQNLDEECDQLFDTLKKYLTYPLLLSQLRYRKVLVLYLSISLQASASSLVQDKGGVRRPVYDTS